jgi:hypothetical protein
MCFERRWNTSGCSVAELAVGECVFASVVDGSCRPACSLECRKDCARMFVWGEEYCTEAGAEWRMAKGKKKKERKGKAD